MLTREDVAKLTNDELHRELKSRGINPGPVSPTTRSIYEKKLIKMLKEVKIPGQPTLNEETVSNLTNDQLYAELKLRGANLGPVSPTTRSIYEKKLLQLLKETKIPGQPSYTQSISPTSRAIYQNISQESNKNTQIPSNSNTYNQRPLEIFTMETNSNTYDEVDDDIPIPISNKSTQKSLYPPLIFKLINNDQNDNYCEKRPQSGPNEKSKASNFSLNNDNDHDSFMKTNNFELTNRLPNPFNKFTHPNERNNGSYLDYVNPRPKNNLINRKQNVDPKLMLNEFRTDYMERNWNPISSTSSSSSLYHEPPPPQPGSRNSSPGGPITKPVKEVQFDWANFLLSYWRFVFSILIFLIVISWTFSSVDNDNPIDA
ncbi:unnamed protein product [Brachionus calyciflorus]|uniref:LEM domain-containing protein n=1 Tax=Brachionus calyciflorus TaxID=104777 RepID=A0A813WWX5_9BILA|nr:unnamed protein product [Brachionus calyciflorus]